MGREIIVTYGYEKNKKVFMHGNKSSHWLSSRLPHELWDDV